jgi:hypothetical protein
MEFPARKPQEIGGWIGIAAGNDDMQVLVATRERGGRGFCLRK